MTYLEGMNLWAVWKWLFFGRKSCFYLFTYLRHCQLDLSNPVPRECHNQIQTILNRTSTPIPDCGWSCIVHVHGNSWDNRPRCNAFRSNLSKYVIHECQWHWREPRKQLLTICAETGPVGTHSMSWTSWIASFDGADITMPARFTNASPRFTGSMRSALKAAFFWKQIKS